MANPGLCSFIRCKAKSCANYIAVHAFFFNLDGKKLILVEKIGKGAPQNTSFETKNNNFEIFRQIYKKIEKTDIVGSYTKK